MRERLFRGRRMYSEEWIYSTTIFAKGDRVYMPRPDTNYIITSHADIVGDIWQIECKRPDCFYRVDPSTIGEYAGEHDKNGKEIFEGDILSNKYAQHNAICVFKKGAFGAQFPDEFFTLARLNGCYFEKIGNIHDNPELLEGTP